MRGPQGIFRTASSRSVYLGRSEIMGILGVLHNIRTKGLGRTLELRRENQAERERLAEDQR